MFCKDSVGSGTTSLSKNQKKRARKRVKKAATDTGNNEDVGGDEIDKERRVEERLLAVNDPAIELKVKLEEAKANKVS